MDGTFRFTGPKKKAASATPDDQRPFEKVLTLGGHARRIRISREFENVEEFLELAEKKGLWSKHVKVITPGTQLEHFGSFRRGKKKAGTEINFHSSFFFALTCNYFAEHLLGDDVKGHLFSMRPEDKEYSTPTRFAKNEYVNEKGRVVYEYPRNLTFGDIGVEYKKLVSTQRLYPSPMLADLIKEIDAEVMSGTPQETATREVLRAYFMSIRGFGNNSYYCLKGVVPAERPIVLMNKRALMDTVGSGLGLAEAEEEVMDFMKHVSGIDGMYGEDTIDAIVFVGEVWLRHADVLQNLRVELFHGKRLLKKAIEAITEFNRPRLERLKDEREKDLMARELEAWKAGNKEEREMLAKKQLLPFVLYEIPLEQ